MLSLAKDGRWRRFELRRAVLKGLLEVYFIFCRTFCDAVVAIYTYFNDAKTLKHRVLFCKVCCYLLPTTILNRAAINYLIELNFLVISSRRRCIPKGSQTGSILLRLLVR